MAKETVPSSGEDIARSSKKKKVGVFARETLTAMKGRRRRHVIQPVNYENYRETMTLLRKGLLEELWQTKMKTSTSPTNNEEATVSSSQQQQSYKVAITLSSELSEHLRKGKEKMNEIPVTVSSSQKQQSRKVTVPLNSQVLEKLKKKKR